MTLCESTDELRPKIAARAGDYMVMADSLRLALEVGDRALDLADSPGAQPDSVRALRALLARLRRQLRAALVERRVEL